MRRLIAVLSLALSALPAAAQEAAPVPPNGNGEWVMLRYAYPAPTTGGNGIDYWISLDVYGEGPDANGIVRVRSVSPGEFNADMQPTRIFDLLQDFDCTNRQQRNVDGGVPGDWYTLPDFVPGARTMFDVCSADFILGRARQPDLATAIAKSSQDERARHQPNPYH